ncbi:MAG: PEGA domain-containing protein [candidate division Zixibacteria bacterium]|nr:PEGA domain-containing protein [candidate division Zixibacteria bacterium]
MKNDILAFFFAVLRTVGPGSGTPTKIRVVRGLYVIFSIWHAATAVGQDDPGYLDLTSVPNGQPVYIDDAPAGPTALMRYPLAPGKHRIRIPHPNRTDWDARDWAQDIHVSSGETIRLHVPFTGPVSVTTDPFDAVVFVDERYVGSTPVRLSDLAPGPHALLVRKSGYEEIRRTLVVADTSRQTLSFTLIPETGPHRTTVSVHADWNGRRQKIIGYAAMGVGAVFGGLALHASREADRAYERYLNTADPVALESAFRRAARYDTRASRYVVVAQVNFATSFYFLVARAFGKQKER